MRLLLDECLDPGIRDLLAGHQITTVGEANWQGTAERDGSRREGDPPSTRGKEPAMFNPIRPELAVMLHRERVNESLRRAARSSDKPPGLRRRARRRPSLRLRMA